MIEASSLDGTQIGRSTVADAVVETGMRMDSTLVEAIWVEQGTEVTRATKKAPSWRKADVEQLVVSRGPTLEALRERSGEQVSYAEMATVANAICSWCDMSAHEAVCRDCGLLRFFGGLLTRNVATQ